MNTKPLTTATHVLPAKRGGEWELEEVKGGVATRVRPVIVDDSEAYFRIPLATLSDGVTPDGENYTYIPDEAGVGDLDGDGEYEIVLSGHPPKRKRGVAQGTAEEDEELVDIKGRILSGPEYLTVFRGLDGAALDTIPFEPARGEVEDWGDTYGNRCDRFLAAVCYFDGRHPSFIIAAPDDRSILVYSSPHPTEYRFHTFMLDPVYRLSIATWPICYNQSPQAGFYFGPDLLGHKIWFRGMYLP